MHVLAFFKWLIRHPLNRTSPISALLRFIRWQVATRLMPTKMALPFVNSTFLLAEKGMVGATGNWYCGLHEPSEMGFFLHSLRPGDLFVDVGANIGSFSVLAAGAGGADAISIEPIPSTFLRLRANIRYNDLEGRVKLINFGVSDREGMIDFTTSFDAMNRAVLPGEAVESISVRVRKLDDFLLGLEPNFIKIDVEGHELSVLRGAQNVLASQSVRAVLMETNGAGLKFGVRDEELFAEMAKYNFLPYTYDPFSRKLNGVINRDAPNTIFLRDKVGLEACCRDAQVFKLCNGTI